MNELVNRHCQAKRDARKEDKVCREIIDEMVKEDARKAAYIMWHGYMHEIDENTRLKELLRYPYELPLNEAGGYEENVQWEKDVKQVLGGDE